MQQQWRGEHPIGRAKNGRSHEKQRGDLDLHGAPRNVSRSAIACGATADSRPSGIKESVEAVSLAMFWRRIVSSGAPGRRSVKLAAFSSAIMPESDAPSFNSTV